MIVLVGGGLLLFVTFSSAFDPPEVFMVVEDSATLEVRPYKDHGCTWILTLTLATNSDAGVEVTGLAIKPRPYPIPALELTALPPGLLVGQGPAQVAHRILDCSDPPTDLDEFSLQVSYRRTDGSTRTESLSIGE